MNKNVVVLLSVVGLLGGCHRHARSGGAEGAGSSGDEGGGQWTFVNQTSSTLCQVWLKGTPMDTQVFHNEPLAPGASVTLNLNVPSLDYVFATDCAEPRTLAGFPDSSMNPNRHPLGITQHTIILHEAGATPSDPNAYAMVAEPRSVRQWVEESIAMLGHGGSNDPQLAAEGLRLAQGMVRQNGWSEELFFAFLTTNGWLMHHELQVGWLGTSIGVGGRGFEAFVGGRWPSGVCAIQDYGFTQQGDGQTWTGPIRPAVGMHVPMPCALVEAIPSVWEGTAR